MSTRLILAGLISLCAMLFGGCGDRFPDYRYKMTIYVDTPEGEKAFSSVRQVRVRQVSSLADSSGQAEKVDLEGEAVILDLPGGPVFALLNKPDDRDYGKYIAYAALAPKVTASPASNEVDEELSPGGAAKHRSPTAYLDEASSSLQKMVKVEGPRDLPRSRPNSDPYRGPREISLWPMFVSFSNPADPSTVHEITPEEIGVKRITIEITRDAVTKQIFDRLPWLKNQHGSLVQPNLHDAAADQPLPTRITEGSFYRTIDQ